MTDISIFPSMVKGLVKPGAVILEAMTPDSADLWHGATGVAGECGELLDACLKAENPRTDIDRENLIEELGDTEFYLEQVRTNLRVNRLSCVAYASMHGADGEVFPFLEFARLAVAGTDLLDAVKKVVVYNKPVEIDAMIERLGIIEDCLLRLRDFYDITREEVLAANVFKLATGPNARYKHGYTDQAAQARADKVPAE